MYSLILNDCVLHSQYVGSFGPYEAVKVLITAPKNNSEPRLALRLEC